MKITVIGTGYVGLVTSVVFSKFGHHVVGLDIDKQKIKLLNHGKIPLYELGLLRLIKKNLKNKKLNFTTSYKKALKNTQVVFICVGTPAKPSGQIDLTYIKSACRMISKNTSGKLLIVIKSTVPPGIQDQVLPILKKSPYKIYLATCPEFLKEGSALHDSFHPDRVIIGAEDKTSADILLKLHKPIKSEKHVFDINSAQMVKYSANAFLANKISFANQIANLCDSVAANAKEVMLGLGLDKRIGSSFLRPGLGFGGSCFPKDTQALSYLARQQGLKLDMVDVALRVNQQQVDIVFTKIKKLLGNLRSKQLAVFGLAFKPNTDDMRQAQAIPLIKKLIKAHVRIKAYDPVAMPVAQKTLGAKDIVYAKNVYQALKASHGLVLVTEWPEFNQLDFKKVRKIMAEPNIIDARNMFNPNKLKKLGFKYLGVGVR